MCVAFTHCWSMFTTSKGKQIQAPDFQHCLLPKFACPMPSCSASLSLVRDSAEKVGRGCAPVEKLGVWAFYLEDLRCGASGKNWVIACMQFD